MRVIISASGTGGHVNPAIAIANKIMEKQPDSKILFIGTASGIENTLIKKYNFQIEHIEAYGFTKKLTFANLKKTFKTFASYFKMKKIIKEFKPDIVIGTGGYICVPVFLAATKLKVPTLLHESNAFPGRAIKMFDRTATRILLGIEDCKKYFSFKKNVRYVGSPTNIIKRELTKEEKAKIERENNLSSNRITLLVTGGSQGAKKINDTMYKMILNNIIKREKNEINLLDKVQIIWATGNNNFEEYVENFKKNNIDIQKEKNISIKPYIYNMAELLNYADLAICRSGAMTITEMAIVGLPAIFIPLPSIGSNRQEDNAKVFEKNECGTLILNNDLNEDILEKKIYEMINCDLAEMSRKARLLAKENVEEDIYTQILEAIEEFRWNKLKK